MPITEQNLMPALTERANKDYIIVQYPFQIESKTFSHVYLFRPLKVTKVIATVMESSTTQTSFSVILPNATLTVIIVAGHGKSNIWEGEVMVSAGSSIFFKSNAHGTGSHLTMIVEVVYQ